MHYVKFKEDYPAYGKKAGQIVRYMNKVPPHVQKYVTKSSQSAYDKQQAGEIEEAEIVQGAVPDNRALRSQGNEGIATPEDKPKRNPKLPNDVIDKQQPQ